MSNFNTTSIVVLTYSELDRIFFENLRLKVVSLGLLPDVKLFRGNPTGYKAAKAAITASGKTVCEIFGPGVSEARDEKTYDKIVINRVRKKPGNWRSTAATFMQPVVVDGINTFDKKLYPDSNYDIDYDIRLITKTNASDTLLSQLFDSVLPVMGYMFTIGTDLLPTINKVLVKYKTDFSIYDKEFIERSFRYCIEEVWLAEPRTVITGIPEMSTVQVDYKYLEVDIELPDQTIVPLISDFSNDMNNDF